MNYCRDSRFAMVNLKAVKTIEISLKAGTNIAKTISQIIATEINDSQQIDDFDPRHAQNQAPGFINKNDILRAHKEAESPLLTPVQMTQGKPVLMKLKLKKTYGL